MKRLLPLLLALVAGAAARAAELPEVKIPEKFHVCAKDSDCAVAGDACRSCGMPIVLHKKYLKSFADLDRKLREEKGFNPACEACSTTNLKLKCLRKKCAVVLPKP